MVTLRPTRKLHTVLPVTTDISGTSDTALGDWYVNRIVVDRRPLLLLVSISRDVIATRHARNCSKTVQFLRSSASLMPLLVPARDVARLPDRIADIVGARLRRLGIAMFIIKAELDAMTPVAIGSTVDRSVLGIMVDFAKSVPFHLEAGRWDDTSLELVEDRLAETPCHAGRSSGQVVFPEKKTPELLRLKWAG